MGQSAQVRSVEALHEFHTGLCGFVEKVRESLVAADMEIHRSFDWLQDQGRYWQQEIRKRHDAVAEARAALARKEIPNALGNLPDCTVEKKALLRAKRRLEEAEEKLQVVRRWGARLQREVDEYQGPARKLAGLLDGDPPRMIALVARKLAALEAYLGLTASSGTPKSGPTQAETAAAEPDPASPRENTP